MLTNYDRLLYSLYIFEALSDVKILFVLYVGLTQKDVAYEVCCHLRHLCRNRSASSGDTSRFEQYVGGAYYHISQLDQSVIVKKQC